MILLVCKGCQIANTYKFYLELEFQVSGYWVTDLAYMLLDMCASMHICAFVYVLGEIYACIDICRFVCMFLCVLEKDTTGRSKKGR